MQSLQNPRVYSATAAQADWYAEHSAELNPTVIESLSENSKTEVEVFSNLEGVDDGYG